MRDLACLQRFLVPLLTSPECSHADLMAWIIDRGIFVKGEQALGSCYDAVTRISILSLGNKLLIPKAEVVSTCIVRILAY